MAELMSTISEVEMKILNMADMADSQEFPWPSILVDVFLDGRGPFPFCVEIGRGRTMVLDSVPRELGIDPAKLKDTIILSGTPPIECPVLKLRSLSVGTAKMENFPVMVWAWLGPHAQASASSDLQMTESGGSESGNVSAQWKGILGFDFLRHFKIRFDFANGKLRFE